MSINPWFNRFALIVTCLLSAAILAHRVDGAGTLRLVDKGKPKAEIVIADNPTRSAQFAAKELQDQIKKISGATLPIRKQATPGATAIYIGESDYVKKAGLANDQFDEQEYVVKFVPDGIILTGKDAPIHSTISYDPDQPTTWANLPSFWEERGSLNAVYDFLERFCGARYFNPTEFGTDLPENSTLDVVEENIRRKPFFRYREVHPLGVHPELVDCLNIMWGRLSPELENWKKEAYPRLNKRFPDKKTFEKAHQNIAYRYLLRSRNGGAKMTTNHSLYPYYRYFLDDGKNKASIEARPEFFSKGWGAGRPEQMCYTNKALSDQVATEAVNYFNGKDITGTHPIGNKNWGESNFAVVPQDNEFHCRCEECRKLLGKDGDVKGFSTDLMFRFVNQVAKQVKTVHPEKTISTLAYAGYKDVPDFALEDNVAVQFCFTGNRGPEETTRYRDEWRQLSEWAEKAPSRGLYLWLYYCFPWEHATNGNYHCFPGFFAHTIGKQFKRFHELGVKGMFHCGYGQEVESYVTFRLMDDPTLNIDQLLDEYFSRMYGPAAKPMRDIYEMIEDIYMNIDNYPRNIRGAELAWKYQGTPERMKTLQELCDQAKKLATKSPYKERVALWEDGVWAYMKKGAAMYKEKTSAPMPNIAVPKVPNANGDLSKVEWEKAKRMDEWFNFGQDSAATRKLMAKFAYDDKYLYIELDDPCDTSKLDIRAALFPCDVWEFFISSQRGMPYRQYAFNPTGKMKALAHGEINFRMNVEIENPGILTQSERLDNLWRLRVALPLNGALADKLVPGEKYYLNIARIASQAISNVPSRFDISTLVSYSSVHDPVRAAELTLE